MCRVRICLNLCQERQKNNIVNEMIADLKPHHKTRKKHMHVKVPRRCGPVILIVKINVLPVILP